MPHSKYTHEVIELTDGRPYCLACDEVVGEEYLRSRGARSGTRRIGSESPGPSSSGT